MPLQGDMRLAASNQQQGRVIDDPPTGRSTRQSTSRAAGASLAVPQPTGNSLLQHTLRPGSVRTPLAQDRFQGSPHGLPQGYVESPLSSGAQSIRPLRLLEEQVLHYSHRFNEIGLLTKLISRTKTVVNPLLVERQYFCAQTR